MCEYNIQNSEVRTALLQMISRPRHEAEACFCGVQRLLTGGAVPLLLMSAFMVWGEILSLLDHAVSCQYVIEWQDDW